MPMKLGGMTLLSLEEIRAAFPERHRPSLETLRRYIRTKALHGRKVGGSWYASTRSLEIFLGHAPETPAEEQDSQLPPAVTPASTTT